MINLKLKKGLTAILSATLATTLIVVTPSVAQAESISCTDVTKAGGASGKSVTFEKCVGKDFQGAEFEIRMPKEFNGTMFIYSHGIRHATTLPIIPGVNPSAVDLATGYPDGWRSKLRTFPIVAPGRSPIDEETNAMDLLSQGFAVSGASPIRGGWAVPEHINANLNLWSTAIVKYPNIKKVVSWGDSLGGHISQRMSEEFGIIDAAIDLHLAGSASTQFAQLGDLVWLFKNFFDPTIVGHGYSTAGGYDSMVSDIGKILKALVALQTAFAQNPTAPVWPDTAPAALRLSPIPSRSAVLLMGLLSGIPTQSTSYDGVTGPPGAETSFALTLNPAAAILENISTVLGLAITAGYDAEMRCDGIVFDNTKTDYSARLGDNFEVFAAGLSGSKAVTPMLGYLSPLNPAAKRVAGNPAALKCLNNQSQYSGAISTPTITLSQTADQVTPPGYVQKLKDMYAAKVEAKAAKPGYLMNIWSKPPDSYTKFGATGALTPPVPTAGTSHFMFTNKQIMAIAKLGAAAAISGKLPSTKAALAAFKKDASIFIDPDYTPALMPQEQ